jgi:hypothetical protein
MKSRIHKEALEKLIEESIAVAKHSHGFFCEDRFLIDAYNDLQVHVVITAEEDEFLDQYPPEYLAAIKEAKADE